jgi:hypothetical protein
MSLIVDRTLKAGDVLTSLTIIVSVVALITTLTKERDTRTREQADRVRVAAAKTLAKLERWQSLQLSLYQELQPVYVDVSESLARRFDVVAARDYLWKQVNAQRVRIAARILDVGSRPLIPILLRTTPRSVLYFLTRWGNSKSPRRLRREASCLTHRRPSCPSKLKS